jgi:hypothetical protein
MTANAGYKAYATGDVLTAAQVQYNLQNQTVMYFATTTARDAALTGAILVEGMVSYTPATGLMYYNGSAWASVSGSANVPTLSNPILNSAFQIAQRGASISLAASSAATYTLDRWQTQTGANQATTVARQATGDTTNLPNIQYALRFQRNSGQTGTSTYNLAQSFESINSIPFAGKTITYSFYARAGANYSATSSALTAIVVSGTGSDQNVVTGFTGAAYPISQAATLTTTWQRFSYTGTVAATATQLGLLFQFAPTGTAGTNDYYEVTGVQLELGSTATPFDTYATTIQGELGACQRYYFRASGSLYSSLAAGSSGNTTTTIKGYTNLPVTMRTKPTSVDYATLAGYDNATIFGGTIIPVIDANVSTPNVANCDFSGFTGLTNYRPYWIVSNNSTSGYLGFSAEL